MVTAVEAANGVMVGVNRESASAGSAAWNFAVPNTDRFRHESKIRVLRVFVDRANR